MLLVRPLFAGLHWRPTFGGPDKLKGEKLVSQDCHVLGLKLVQRLPQVLQDLAALAVALAVRKAAQRRTLFTVAVAFGLALQL